MKTRLVKICITLFCLMFVVMFQGMTSDVFATCDGSGDCNVPLGYKFTVDSKQAIKMSESYSVAQCGGYCLRDIYIGENSGGLNPNADNRALGNVFVGRNTGSSLEIGAVNTFIGDKAAENLKYSLHNTYVGAGAGSVATFNPEDPTEYSPSYNTIVGSIAGQYNLGVGNVFMGTEAGRMVTTGSVNTFIGLNAAAGHERTGGKPGGGRYAIDTGSNNIFIGEDTEATRGDISSSIAIGNLAKVEGDNQMVIGGGLFYTKCDGNGCVEVATCTPGSGVSCYYHNTAINESFWGSGVTSVNPLPFSFNATGGSGTNVAGGDVIIAGGKGTGSANGGSIKFQTSAAGSSGSSQNSLQDRVVIDSNGNVTIGDGSDRFSPTFTLHALYGDCEFQYDSDNAWLKSDCSPNISSDKRIYFRNRQAWISAPTGATLQANATSQLNLQSPKIYITGTDANGTPNDNDIKVGIGTSTPSYPLEMASGAYVSAGGVWTDASSRDYKENISDFSADKAIETLKGLNPVEYNYKVDKEERHIGFIAEEVPGIVATKDRKGLSPMDIVAVLTRVVKEQQKKFEEQGKIIAALNKKLIDLEREVKLKDSMAMVDTDLK